MIDFEVVSEMTTLSGASIKVIGVGGAGGNTVNSLLSSGCSDIESIVANTDAQVLRLSKAHHAVHIGVKSTKGLGTGANPDLGKRAAEEDLDKIMEVVGDADIVFLTGGMGGGTGSGALPVIAHALRERGILSIAIVTKPFIFEGKRRASVAQKAIETLRKEVDTLIIIPNQKLLEFVGTEVSMIDAFALINDVLSKAVKGISDIITKPGHINVDFADVRTIMKDMGLAVLGTGVSSGQHRAKEAALKAISSPLLENMNIKGARGVLLNITGGKNLGIHEISHAASVIYEQAHEDATIILGSVIEESMADEVMVTIIATGFETQTEKNVSVEAQQNTVQPPTVAMQDSKIVGSVLDVSTKLESVNPKKEGTVDAQKDDHKEMCKMPHEVVEEHVTGWNLAKEIIKTTAHTESVFQASKASDLDQTDRINIDVNDLDVPAFLRKDLVEKKAE